MSRHHQPPLSIGCVRFYWSDKSYFRPCRLLDLSETWVHNAWTIVLSFYWLLFVIFLPSWVENVIWIGENKMIMYRLRIGRTESGGHAHVVARFQARSCVSNRFDVDNTSLWCQLKAATVNTIVSGKISWFVKVWTDQNKSDISLFFWLKLRF